MRSPRAFARIILRDRLGRSTFPLVVTEVSFLLVFAERSGETGGASVDKSPPDL